MIKKMKQVVLWNGKVKNSRPSTHQEYRLLNAILILDLVNTLTKKNHDSCFFWIDQSEDNFSLTLRWGNGGGHILPVNGKTEKELFDNAWKFVAAAEWQMSDRITKYNKFMQNTTVKCCGMYYTYETRCNECEENPQLKVVV